MYNSTVTLLYVELTTQPLHQPPPTESRIPAPIDAKSAFNSATTPTSAVEREGMSTDLLEPRPSARSQS